MQPNLVDGNPLGIKDFIAPIVDCSGGSSPRKLSGPFLDGLQAMTLMVLGTVAREGT